MEDGGKADRAVRMHTSPRQLRRMGTGGGSAPPPPPSPVLPPDLLLEVLGRCDHETLVRCAIASKFLCRCMRDDPAFLPRRPSGFAPSLLLGALDAPRGAAGASRFAEAPTPSVVPREPVRSFLSSNAELLASCGDILTCDRGLVIFRRGTESRPVELCVCEPMTGRHWILPPALVDDRRIAILTGEDAGSSGNPFQLLAVSGVFGYMESVAPWCYHVESQLFSSQESVASVKPAGSWGPVRRAVPPAAADYRWPCLENPPIIINRVAHWPCDTGSGTDVLALGIVDGRAAVIKGPREVSRSYNMLLAATRDRRLSIVVADDLVVSVLVLSSLSEEWEPSATIIIEGISAPNRWMRLDCFGQRSGIVVFCTHCAEGRYYLLNLDTKEVMHMPTDRDIYWRGRLFEMDLESLIAFMLKSPSP